MAYWYLGGGNLNVGDKYIDLLDRTGALSANARAQAASGGTTRRIPRATDLIDPDATRAAARERTAVTAQDYAAREAEANQRMRMQEDARQFNVAQANAMARAREEQAYRNQALSSEMSMKDRAFGLDEKRLAADLARQAQIDADRKTALGEKEREANLVNINRQIDDLINARSKAEAIGNTQAASALNAQVEELLATRRNMLAGGAQAPAAPQVAPQATPEVVPVQGEPRMYDAPDGTQRGEQSAPMPVVQQEAAQDAQPGESDPEPKRPAKTGDNYKDSIAQAQYERQFAAWSGRENARQQRQEAGARIALSSEQAQAMARQREVDTERRAVESEVKIAGQKQVQRDRELRELERSVKGKDHLKTALAIQRARESMQLTPQEADRVLRSNPTANEQALILRDAPEGGAERVEFLSAIAARMTNLDQLKAMEREGANVSEMRSFIKRQLEAARLEVAREEAARKNAQVPGYVSNSAKMLEYLGRRNPLTAAGHLAADWMGLPSTEAALQTEQRVRNAPRNSR